MQKSEDALVPKKVIRFVLPVLLAWLALSGLFAHGATYLIEPDGSGAFPTIQAAIDAALPGDVIELADGVFKGTGNRDLNFNGKAITIRSLSGNPRLSIIDGEGVYPTTVHRGFDFKTAEGAGSVVSNITIRNCATDDC